MADRSAASVFAEIFHALAEMKRGNSPDIEDLTHKFWEAAKDYDFSPYQMFIDEDLIELGYAVRAVHPSYPKDGETTIYDGDEAFERVYAALSQTEET